jgi:hypothetical protein
MDEGARLRRIIPNLCDCGCEWAEHRLKRTATGWLLACEWCDDGTCSSLNPYDATDIVKDAENILGESLAHLKARYVHPASGKWGQLPEVGSGTERRSVPVLPPNVARIRHVRLAQSSKPSGAKQRCLAFIRRTRRRAVADRWMRRMTDGQKLDRMRNG